jgi:hypothetical protein
MKVIGRVVSLFLIMLWWGGLTFYSAIVVPIGTNVLQSSEQQGLVTQQVTKYLNALGLVAAVVLAWNAWQYRAIAKTKLFRGLLVGSLILFSTQLLLYGLHARLSDLLLHDADRAVFYSVHRVYLLAVGLQWLSGTIAIVGVIALWRLVDKVNPRSPGQ